MSIVRMKRLSLMALAEDRDKILRLLAHVGAVEISETSVSEGFDSEVQTDSERLSENLAQILASQTVAKKYSKLKRGMFSPRLEMTESELLAPEVILEAIDEAEKINRNDAELSRLRSERARLVSLRETFMPWKSLDVALDTPSGSFYETTLLTLPKAVNISDIETAVSEISECAEFNVVSTDKELHYIFLIAYRGDAEKVRDALKQFGAAIVKFRGVSITAKEKMQQLDGEISDIELKIKEAEEKISVTSEQFDKLLVAQDALETRLACANAAEQGASSERTFYIEGWCPAREEKMLSQIFEANGCAYEFSDPADGDEPPTLTYNSKFIAPFTTITNMYSPPAYRGIDPNPLMAPFFALFFGIMLSDAAYGLLLMLAGIFALWKMKPKGGFRNFMQLAIICGASTVLWGLLFGGFFGNAIPAAYEMFTGKVFPYNMALWFDPSQDPMMMLIFSMALGGVQIVTGMAVKGYLMIRDGQVWDAIFDIGSWWLVFAGGITCIFNTNIGLYILIAGVAALILTQGRAKKNVIMKFFSGVLSLYDVTSYFSDILSYSRLLALSLATAVVSQVINTMGVLTGPVGFFIVFLIGHVFNIAINLIGSFVHAARLQYVEYFGRFYESGGRLFAPLTIKTKNIDVIKEEI